MPNDLNKQSLINLLIDSPLREPIKINLIDIVNNTSDVDLPKIFPTIVKELEIFQKATERRMKLAEETIGKLSSDSPAPAPEQAAPVPDTTPVMSTTPEPVTPSMTPVSEPTSQPPLSVPPLDLPPLPQIPTPAPEPLQATPIEPSPTSEMPTPATPSLEPAPPTTTPLPTPEPLGTPSAPAAATDEAALAEIQKELESLKAGVTADAAAPVTTTPPVQA